MKKFIAEFIGTFALVLFGCGTAAVVGARVGVLGIAFAFGLALIAMAYGIGPISGCHINPAVSLGVFAAGRMTAKDLVLYIIAQFLGGIAGALVLYIIMKGRITEYNVAVLGLGQNGWGYGYNGQYNVYSACIFEFIATFLFLVVILGSTQPQAPTQIAGVAIGLTLVVIHIFGINITGVSVNPARSLGPALFSGAKALAQVWLFLVVPSVAGALAGIFFRFKVLSKD
jgi:aquaporin Z